MHLLRDGNLTKEFFLSVLNTEEKELSEIAQKRVRFTVMSHFIDRFYFHFHHIDEENVSKTPEIGHIYIQNPR